MSSSSARWRKVSIGDIAEADRHLVSVEGREIAIFRVDGELVAFDNACPHEGNPLVHGDVLGDTLTCAYHGWRFDLATGACLVGDAPVRRYDVELRGGDLWIALEPE
jgi:nitrite reductase/ring-hydroxylating ferredoxin subunit